MLDAVQWKCEANLPEHLSFRSTTVVCEGYDSPEDTYILAGSCGLEYELYSTGALTADWCPQGTPSFCAARAWPPCAWTRVLWCWVLGVVFDSGSA